MVSDMRSVGKADESRCGPAELAKPSICSRGRDRGVNLNWVCRTRDGGGYLTTVLVLLPKIHVHWAIS